MTVFRRTISPFQVMAIGLSLLLVMVLLQAFLFYEQQAKTAEARKWVAHTYEVLDAIRTPFAKIKDAQIAQRGYILTGDERFLEPYYAAIGDARANGRAAQMGYLDTSAFANNLAELRALVKESPEQAQTLNRLEMLMNEEMKFIAATIIAYQKKPDEAIAMIRTGRGKARMDEVRTLVTRMMAHEQALLTGRLEEYTHVGERFSLLIVFCALFTYGGLFIAILLITRFFFRAQQSERELQAKEAYFRAAAEGGVDAFFIFQSVRGRLGEVEDLRLEYINHIASRMLGQTGGALSGKTVEAVLTHGGDTPEAVRRRYLDILRGGKVREIEYYAVAGPKTGSYYQEQIVPLPDGIAVSCRDITERKQMERMKNEFVSTVSHELRTPLTSIRGSLGLVLGDNDDSLSGDTKDLLGIAYNNCERLVRLINDILDVEKIESGKMAFECRPMALAPVLQQAMDANRSFADKYNVRMVLAESGAAAAEVVADSDRLMQVLTNLLSNAIKFSPQGSAVRLSCTAEGAFVRIAVADEGSGIPAEFHDRIFQKFAQADGSDTRQKGGTGLGLSIVKAIVEEMGGTIGFMSEEGKGATFHFTLPATQSFTAGASATTASAADKRERILVCEDEADIANLLRLILERTGFAVDLAPSAAAAYELLQKNSYTAMTLDLMLPDKDGITFLRELRAEERFAGLPIIVVSAKAEEGRKELSGDAINVVDWMHKPIDMQRLVQTVQNLGLRRHPHILHVEDDIDITHVLRHAIGKIANIISAPTLHQARNLLQQQIFDLVVLDIVLPDGKGTDLLPLLGSESRHPTPVILFTANDISKELSKKVAASLTKSLTTEEKLMETIRQFLTPQEAPPQKKEKRA